MVVTLIVAGILKNMVFNHYAKLARIITELKPGWYIRRIDEPTTTTRFDGGRNHYDHYYRLFHVDGSQVPYGKFQQLDKLASVLAVNVSELSLVN